MKLIQFTFQTLLHRNLWLACSHQIVNAKPPAFQKKFDSKALTLITASEYHYSKTPRIAIYIDLSRVKPLLLRDYSRDFLHQPVNQESQNYTILFLCRIIGFLLGPETIFPTVREVSEKN